MLGGLEVANFRPSPSRQTISLFVPLHPRVPRVRGCLTCARDTGFPANEKESGTPFRSQVLLSYFRVGDNPPVILPNYVLPDVFQRKKREFLNSGRLPIPVREFSESGWNVD